MYIFKFIKKTIQIANREKMHFFWLMFVFIFSFLDIWTILLLKPLKDISYSNLNIYSTLIGILAPSLFSLMLKIYLEKKYDKDIHFFRTRLTLVFIGLPFVTLLPILSLGCYGHILWLQILFVILILLYSFMCYLALYLDPNEDLEMDDDYELENKAKINEIKNNAKELNSTNINGIETNLK